MPVVTHNLIHLHTFASLIRSTQLCAQSCFSFFFSLCYSCALPNCTRECPEKLWSICGLTPDSITFKFSFTYFDRSETIIWSSFSFLSHSLSLSVFVSFFFVAMHMNTYAYRVDVVQRFQILLLSVISPWYDNHTLLAHVPFPGHAFSLPETEQCPRLSVRVFIL